MNQVKLGIIGLGNMGSGHCSNILAGLTPEIKLTAAADLRQSRRDWAKETLPDDVVLFENGDQLIESGLCDAVIIATPHYEHPRLAILAFEHGLHVMSEKPAGVYTKQVREMNEAAIRSGKVFGMMFNQRTNCVYRKMHEMVQSGKYGQIKRVNWIITDWYRPQAYYDSGSWRATWAGEGGGVLLNQCPHQLDLWQWICGMPVKVQSHLRYGQWHDIEVEDDVTTYVEYENGATGVFVINAWGGAILRGTPLVADGREGIRGLTLSNAMHLSAFLGREVRIPYDEDLYYEELMKRVAASRYRKDGAEKVVFADVSDTYGGNK